VLRLAGFFLLAIVLASLLGQLPLIGPLFARTGCIGIWISAMLLSWAFTKLGQRAYRLRRDAGEIHRLKAVDSPHTHGKLGTLYLNQGRKKRALEHLQKAVDGEPDVTEWHYRLGCALLASGDAAGAAEAFGHCVDLDEEYAYGAAQMRLAEALTREDRHAAAIEALETLERNHGPSPESAYRRGVAHKAEGDRDAATAAFHDVGRLASEVARYQKKSAFGWTSRAWMAQRF